ncbi:MAG: DNA double-strand break repair nuclease NurA [Anaerolineales bacterium]
MPINYQQVRQKITEVGAKAPERVEQRTTLLEQVTAILAKYTLQGEILRDKVERVSKHIPNLRCAKPTEDPLTFTCPLPAPPSQACLLAMDGSQVAPSRHDQVEFGLINLGMITLPFGGLGEIQEEIESVLLFDEELAVDQGRISEQQISLRRDLRERTRLAERAETLPRPLFTFTDGPLELWFGPETQSENESTALKRTRDEYIAALQRLHASGACTAGYIDKPASDLVLRLLELAELDETKLTREWRGGKYQMLRDLDLFRRLLQPGERSAIFAIHSRPTRAYTGPVALHFFYLNVGRAEKPWIARVEIPLWVAENPSMLAHLHALLIHECNKLGTRPYPYILHRSHEIAVVKMEEKKQVEQMLAQNLGIFDGGTYKQGHKDSGGRTSLT